MLFNITLSPVNPRTESRSRVKQEYINLDPLQVPPFIAPFTIPLKTTVFPMLQYTIFDSYSYIPRDLNYTIPISQSILIPSIPS